MGKRILVVDIETAPNTVAVYQLNPRYISPKYILDHGYVLCYSAKWIGEREVFYAKSPDGHKAMLEEIHGLLSQADGVVHYYGKKFDMPTLNSEFILHGLAPLPPLVQIDLYYLVRRAFNFPSYKLDYVCQRLGLGGKAHHQGWELWKACMNKLHERHDHSWVVMERYNKRDVTLTERLYRKVLPWFGQTHGFKRINEWLLGRRTNP